MVCSVYPVTYPLSVYDEWEGVHQLFPQYALYSLCSTIMLIYFSIEVHYGKAKNITPVLYSSRNLCPFYFVFKFRTELCHAFSFSPPHVIRAGMIIDHTD
jgi:hypothetical protein